jgi:hypothetical protein
MDVGELRRRWKDVINAVKAVRPAASKLFLDTEADVDGDTVVVEFDPSRKILVRRAEEQDVVALLRDAIRDVLGWHVGIRYQLGRGAVRRGEPDVSAAGVPPVPAAQAAGDGDALDRMFLEGLGAEIVSTDGSADAAATAVVVDEPAPPGTDGATHPLFLEDLGAEVIPTDTETDGKDPK